MAIVVGELLVKIGSDVAKIQNDMGKAVQVYSRTVSTIKRVMGSLGVAIAASFSTKAMARFFSDVVENAHKIEGASHRFIAESDSMVEAVKRGNNEIKLLASQALEPVLPLMRDIVNNAVEAAGGMNRMSGATALLGQMVARQLVPVAAFAQALAAVVTIMESAQKAKDYAKAGNVFGMIGLGANVSGAMQKLQGAQKAAEGYLNSSMFSLDENGNIVVNMPDIKIAEGQVAASDIQDQSKRLTTSAKKIAPIKLATSQATKMVEDTKKAIKDLVEAAGEDQRRMLEESRERIRAWADYNSQAFVDWTRTGKLSVKDMVQSILDDALRIQASKMILQPLFGSIFGGFSNWLSQPAPHALGDVVYGPKRFGSGGHVMGENGAEAILPLARGSDGRLGVLSGGGSGVNVQIIDQRQSGERPEVESSTGTDGRQQIRVLIRDEVRAGLAGGAFDRDMAMNYGLRRGGRAPA